VENARIVKLTALGITAVCVLIMFLMTFFRVEQYERGVVTWFGKVQYLAEPGLNFKVPFAQTVTFIRTDIRSVVPSAAVNTYTIDNQEVDIVFNLFYRVPPDRVAYVYENVPDFRERLFNMAVDRLKSEMGKVNATHVAEQRGAIRDKITKVLEKDVTELGVIVTDFQLTNIDYTKSFRAAVEAAASAKANVDTREQERIQAEKVAQKVKVAAIGEADAQREKAKGNADAILLNATAEAKAIQLKGEAEARAIHAQAEALRQNAALVELRKAERWNGALPVQMLSNVLPMMQFKSPGDK
jgi:regulator of protease activity HflC (stomatin/prohibitin superfamily)